MSNSFRKFSIYHVRCVCTTEVVHQIAHVIISFILAVDEDDMGSIVQLFVGFLAVPVVVIDWFPFVEYVLLGYEHYEGLHQVLQILTRFRHISIKHAGVISGTLGRCSSVCPLDFDVVDFIIGFSPYIEKQTTTLEVLDVFLGFHLLHHKLRLLQYDPKDQLYSWYVVPKTGSHKVIVHQSELLHYPAFS